MDSLEVSERFLWDLRQTVSDLIVENYAGQFHKLANQRGLRLSIEAYGEPADDMTYAGQTDEPMSEFWSWGKFGAAESCTEMASAAHTYGKRILGAEAFTATDAEKWLGHPGNIKDLGDWAFCEGVNRFVFHRYAAQPWVDRASRYVDGAVGFALRADADVVGAVQGLARLPGSLPVPAATRAVRSRCLLSPAGSAPRQFVPPPAVSAAPFVRGGYNFDGCTPEVVLTRMRVADGRIVLPDGMSYRVLVLPEVETMTPTLLSKIKELVEAGATVFTPTRPRKTPGLTGYPACDQQVQQVTQSIWGDGTAPAQLTERPLGHGRVIWGGELSPQPGDESDQSPDLTAAKWIWHREGNPAAAAPTGTRYFRRVVTWDQDTPIASAKLLMTADNAFECWVNGRRVSAGDNYTQAYLSDIKSVWKPGANIIAVAAKNVSDVPNPAGLIGLLVIRLKDGQTFTISTDQSWKSAETAPGDWTTAATDNWGAAMELGLCGMAPWGEPQYMPAIHNVFPDAGIVHRWLAKNGVPPDFSASQTLRYTHRRIGETDVYFVANGTEQNLAATCSFRVTGKQPELWHPETGRVVDLPFYKEQGGCTDVLLQFGPTESVFVVFRRPSELARQLVSVHRAGRDIMRLETPTTPLDARSVSNTLTMAAWVKPAADTLLPRESREGVTAYAAGRNDVVFPPPGHEVWGELQAGAGLAVGRNGICVHEHGADHFPAVLVYPMSVTDWTHVAVVYSDGTPSLYVNGQLVRTGLKSGFVVHPGLHVAHTRPVAPFQGALTDLQAFDHALSDEAIAKMAQTPPSPTTADGALAVDLVRGEIWQPGNYELQTADGHSRGINIAQLPPPRALDGPWNVSFDPRWGGPADVTFETLEDWAKRSEVGIRYYSGTAVYRKNFSLESDFVKSLAGHQATRGERHCLYLNLGQVAVMADVKLNGHELGIVWKAPYRVDISEAVQPGQNQLEVKVVNLWINRQIGDEQLPEDSERNPGGTLKNWPAWLQQGQPSPTGRLTFTSWRLWNKNDALQPSGLLGPVTLQTAMRYDLN